LQTSSPSFSVNEGLFKAESEQGICKVICFSPDHSKSLADMAVEDIEKVVKTWQTEFLKMGSNDLINYVQIFENKGAVMGCSNPHPHGQIWSQSTLPNEVDKKDQKQKAYYDKNTTSLLGDYLIQELEADERIIYQNEDVVVLIPFWAVWPFETMIVPKRHQQNIAELSDGERLSFADAISKITKIYDRLFECSFPYSSGIHQSPTNGKPNKHWHWHMSFYPPLLRSATVKKFMVGYEMFGSPQRDITAEQAADRLKNLL
jgi:UDPglucose--hexose-1-phosphate uridylyltransferase